MKTKSFLCLLIFNSMNLNGMERTDLYIRPFFYDQKVYLSKLPSDLKNLVIEKCCATTNNSSTILKKLNSQELLTHLEYTHQLPECHELFKVMLEKMAPDIVKEPTENTLSCNPELKDALLSQCFKQIPGLSYWFYKLRLEQKKLVNKHKSAHSVVWNADDSQLATYSNRSIKKYNKDGTFLKKLKIPSSSYSKPLTRKTNDFMLVNCESDGKITISDTSNTNIHTIYTDLKGSKMNCVDLSPDGSKLATLSEGKLKI